MKAIGVKMVDLNPMGGHDAYVKGYKVSVNDMEANNPGYEVTYADGYKSWTPQEVADKAYLMLDYPDGSKLTQKDIDNFAKITRLMTFGEKTTVIQVDTRTGFEYIDSSSCVDPKHYDEKLGAQFAFEHVKEKLWSNLGFVLQWAKNGLTKI